MALRHPRFLDLGLGLCLAALGIIFVAVASRGSAAAFHFVPALDGCLTMGVVGFGLCLIEGYGYATALLTIAPVIVIQSMGTQQHHASWFALIGMEATVLGAVGVLIGLLASRRAHHDHGADEALRTRRPLAEAISA